MERECMKEINHHCQKYRLKPVYEVVKTDGPTHDPVFTVKLKMDGVEYGTGMGKSKKEAKEEAARITLEMINTSQETSSSVHPVTLQPVSPSDYVSMLNMYSQKTSQMVGYPNMQRTGSPHAPMFSCNCCVNGSVYGTGTGASQGAAKQAAAKEAVERLKDQGFLMVVVKKSNCCPTPSEHSHSTQAQPQPDLHVSSTCFEDLTTVLSGKMKGLEIGRTSSPPLREVQRDTQSSDPKCHRKLLANFDNARNKEEKKTSNLVQNLLDLDMRTSEERSPYTVNERFLESFKNVEPIGEGGFGNVFKATAKLDKRTYAVKRVEFTQKVEREVEQLARLEHENIVRYYGSWEGNDYVTYPDSRQKSNTKIKCLFIQMELCDQGTLENWIEKKRQEKKYHEMAQSKFLQILQAVKYIHSKRLIHRDLKPQNILISCDDKIKIGDFGLVTSVEYVTRTENKGTKSYMAPEQGAVSYGNEVDIYALGLIWFEILSACSVHEKSKIWPAIREGRLPEHFTAQFPAEAPIIKKMLSRNPSGRYSASEILLLLKPVDKNNLWRTCTQ